MATTMRTGANAFEKEVNVQQEKMRRRYRGVFIYDQFASPEVSGSLQANAGTNTVQFLRVNSLPVAQSTNTSTATKPFHETTTLPEGSNPTAHAITKDTTRVNLNQYGTVVAWSDRVAAESVLNIPAEVRELLMENNVEVMDSVFQSALTKRDSLTGEMNNVLTQIEYANGAAVNAVNTAFTVAKLNDALITLRTNKTPLWTQPNTTSDRTDTENLMASYVVICSPEQGDIIAADTNFLPIEKYGSVGFPTQMTNGNLYYTEIGAYRYRTLTARIFVSNNKYALEGAGAAGADIGVVHAFGKGFYGNLKSANQQFQLIFTNRPDTGNTLMTQYHLGWKMVCAASIINPANGVAIYSTTV